MKSFYTILYAPVRQASGEQIAVGLLLNDGTKSYYHYSAQKLEIIKKLIPSSAYLMLKSYLVGLDTELIKNTDSVKEKMVSEEYVQYLSNYNYNLLTYSKPTPVAIETTEENFIKLFEKFVFRYNNDQLISEKEESIDSIEIMVKRDLFPKIKHNVNFNQRITPKEIPTLFIPVVKVSFIGRNENPVAGEVVDFNKSEEVLSNTLGKYITLIKAFELNNETGKYFVIGKEPAKKIFPEQHSIWKHIHETSLMKFVDSDETAEVSKFILKHNVVPFIS